LGHVVRRGQKASGGVGSVADKSFGHLGFLLQVDLLLAADFPKLLGQPVVEGVPVVLVHPLPLDKVVPAPGDLQFEA